MSSLALLASQYQKEEKSQYWAHEVKMLKYISGDFVCKPLEAKKLLTNWFISKQNDILDVLIKEIHCNVTI